MLLVAFFCTLAAFIMGIMGLVQRPQHAKMLIGVYVFYYLIALLAVFVMLPSKALFSLIILNVISGIAYLPFLAFSSPNVTIEGPEKSGRPRFRSRNRGLNVAAAILGLLFLTSLFGAAQTRFGVKPVYNSLKIKTMKTAPLLDKDATPIAIAPKTVRNKMNKAMSTVPNTSYYKLGDLQTQVVKGKTVYIAPVEFDGFWRWQRARETPGYFMIDATNVNAEPHFVKQSMKYTPSAYLMDDAQRVIYNRFPGWVQEGQPQLEIKDNGEPYFIQTVYKARGVSSRINYHSLHVVVLNAKTGATSLYAAAKAPKFINESIASSTAAEMNDIFGWYGNGYFNAHFNKTGVKEPNSNGTEDGVTPVVDKHGDISYFNDFTSPKTSADSTMGYSMINARTGTLTYYTGKNIGVMDSDGAKKIAEKEYVAQKWTATMPIMYNIDGTPTWVVSLLDSTGAFRSYAYIKAADQSVKAYATTATQALDQYRVQLASVGSTASSTTNSKVTKTKGTVERVVVIPNGDTQNVLFALKGNDTLWTVGTADYPKAVLMKAGDRVKLTGRINQSAKTGTVETYTNQTFK
ncbi:hypothetical protein [Levilactobacillus tongjiangensis]|uniref:DNA-binding protein n=1 Tax=Levilactobacillus tongjiangensis TaxID=2486023 RepID=A0ABW1SUR1_9LACO|nr:hypothetical protein [Levilactobacillus tongjiangensis]